MAIAVQFKRRGIYQGKRYTYLTDQTQGVIKIGDFVKVPVGNQFKVARVYDVNVSANNPRIRYKQISCVTDLSEGGVFELM